PVTGGAITTGPGTGEPVGITALIDRLLVSGPDFMNTKAKLENRQVVLIELQIDPQ
ncbi:hypothetical protein BGZ52_003198, partial [Haplosporangium bisporale]